MTVEKRSDLYGFLRGRRWRREDGNTMHHEMKDYKRRARKAGLNSFCASVYPELKLPPTSAHFTFTFFCSVSQLPICMFICLIYSIYSLFPFNLQSLQSYKVFSKMRKRKSHIGTRLDYLATSPSGFFSI